MVKHISLWRIRGSFVRRIESGFGSLLGAFQGFETSRWNSLHALLRKGNKTL